MVVCFFKTAILYGQSYVQARVDSEVKTISIPESNDYSKRAGIALKTREGFASWDIQLDGYVRNGKLLSSYFNLDYSGLGIHLDQLSIAAIAGFHLPMRKAVRYELNTASNRWIYGLRLHANLDIVTFDLAHRIFESNENRSKDVDNFEIIYAAYPYTVTTANLHIALGPVIFDFTTKVYSQLKARYDVIVLRDEFSHPNVLSHDLVVKFKLPSGISIDAMHSRTESSDLDVEKLLRIIGLNAFPSGVNSYGLGLSFHI